MNLQQQLTSIVALRIVLVCDIDTVLSFYSRRAWSILAELPGFKVIRAIVSACGQGNLRVLYKITKSII